MTEEEARALITRLYGTAHEILLYPFEFGWLATPTLSEEERAKGMHVGQGNFIIDQTGVVTAHSSLPIPMIMEDYAEARRAGRITGRQIWPKVEPTP